MSGTTNLTNISTIFNVDSISVQLIPQKKGKMLQIKSNYVRKWIYKRRHWETDSKTVPKKGIKIQERVDTHRWTKSVFI